MEDKDKKNFESKKQFPKVQNRISDKKNQKAISISIMNKTSMEQYQQFQDYTNYIDTSDVMLGFYKDQPGTGLEKYYLMIEEWLNMESESVEENKPLVIQAEGGVGKKTLLVKWFEYHQQLVKARGKDDLIILHFATTGGNNSNYYYAIYRILIKLREELNIGQKVELHEEKLRNYFAYWLDVCDQKIERQVIENVDKVFSKIILVFEGIDYFVDRGTNKEGNISFWLPKYFPKNVKVIVTADRESESMNYFNKLNCPRVNIPVDMQIIRTMMKTQLNKKLCIEGPIVDNLMKILDHNAKEVQVTSLYVKSFLSCLLPQKLEGLSLTSQSLQFIQKNLQKLDTARLSHVKNVENLFDYVLDFWSKVLFNNEEKFKELIGLLISTQKGLTRQEIISITKIDSEELKQFITVFRAFLMNFKDLWMIKNDSFKKSISKKYEFNQQSINQKIAEALKKTPNSVRKLEEETFQLYSAGNYFKLKEVISDIENFLLLFNPYTKYDLCRYWQKLEEKSFDPVIEYNKAIEGFEMHYHPNSDDLFRIITQISRFLKQFADFQTYYTPEFRHPKIIGNLSELEDIGILGELKNLELCEDEEDPTKKENMKTEMQQHEQNNENDEEKKYKKKLKEMYDKIEEGKHIKKITKVEIEPVTKVSQKGKGKQNEKKPVVQKEVRVQQLNVEVKSNQNYFREHYYNEIKPFLQKVSLQGEKETFALDEGEGEEYVESDQETQREGDHIVQKIRNNMESKDSNGKSRYENLPDLKNLYAKTVEEEFELNQKPPTNYYYKRWIWMQFPWVCMTMKSDYSDKLRKCFTSPTSYMSVSEEREFTIQALKIALEAKKKKQAILEKSEEPPVRNTMKKTTFKDSTQSANDTARLDKSINDATYLKENKFDQSIFTSQREKKQRRIQELGFVTNSFLSLHNLSKEMESLNITINTDKKPNQSRIDESKGTLFITENDGQNNTLNQSQSCINLFNKKRKMNKEIDESMNLTTSKSRQGLLPRIKQSVNTSMMKELEELEKNNAQLRKNMDTYIYKNKILAKRLKELKIIQYNNKSQLKNEKKIQEKKEKIRQIEAKIEKVKYLYANSLLEHERQDLLIKICKRNKTNNEEKIPELVQECNNFKKMIKIESEAILQLKKKTDEIKKLTRKFVSNYCEKIENEIQLQEEIKQTLKNRENFIEEVEKYDKLIEEEVEEKRKQLNEQILNGSNICQKDIEKNESMCHSPTKSNGQFGNQSKKWSNHNGASNSAGVEEQNYEETFKELMKYLNIESENFQEDPKYIKLVEGLNKKREFEAVIDERKIELEELKKRYAELKHELETLDRAKEQHSLLCGSQGNNLENDDDQELADNETITTGKEETEEQLEKQLAEKKRMLTKATDVRLACLGMLNTWYVRLGLPEQKNLLITKEFLERLEEIKVMNKVQVC